MAKPLRILLPLSGILLATTALLSSCAPSGPTVSALTLEPQGAEKTAPGYFPIPIQLSPEKPASVTKEPKYRAKPQYATVTLGGEGGHTYPIALDEPQGGPWKVYVDLNRNGDLTDDGDGAWSGKRSQGGNTLYGPNRYIFDVAWKQPNGQISEGKYGLTFLRPSEAPVLGMFREGARTGTLKLAGKVHKVVLVENDADALYSKPAATADDAKKGRPVWLLVDLNDDGKFAAEGGEMVDVRVPFKLADQTYESTVSADGAKLSLAPSRKAVPDLTAKAESADPPPALPDGTEAPNFKVPAPNGETIELAQYRGQIVVLDFWSTWCGPCQMSMPHVEKVYQAVKNQSVVVLAVCVFDEKENYLEWLPQNKDKYHFQFAFDPAGRDDATSIAASKYKTNGIPATYVIDKEGKIAATISGFAEGDTRIEDALKKLGVSGL